jgi:hypothetical protein
MYVEQVQNCILLLTLFQSSDSVDNIVTIFAYSLVKILDSAS